MDITLERILSLIPKKPNGEFVHGSLKAFANSIGLKSGNLISDWINDRSRSYTNYLYEIAMKYNVSVEWLKGETDDPTMTGDGQKNKPSTAIDEELLDSYLIKRLVDLTPEEMAKVARTMLSQPLIPL